MFGVALAAILGFGVGLEIVVTWHRVGSDSLHLSPVRVGVLGLIAFVVAAGLIMAPARRLARPIQDLARAADRIGSGDARPVGRRYGIGELDRVAEGLDNAAQRVTDLISAEQDFAVDASHQLRTPLTALSMRLEEMVVAAENPDVVREEGTAALAQTDRLAQVVGQLLGRARRSSSGAPRLSSIDDIISQQVTEWEPAFPAGSRKLEGTGGKGVPAYLRSGGLSPGVA